MQNNFGNPAMTVTNSSDRTGYGEMRDCFRVRMAGRGGFVLGRDCGLLAREGEAGRSPRFVEGDVGPPAVFGELPSRLIRVGNREDATSNARCRTVTLFARLQITYESDERENRVARGEWAAAWGSFG